MAGMPLLQRAARATRRKQDQGQDQGQGQGREAAGARQAAPGAGGRSGQRFAKLIRGKLQRTSKVARLSFVGFLFVCLRCLPGLAFFLVLPSRGAPSGPRH
jgi:hypothetical protein